MLRGGCVLAAALTFFVAAIAVYTEAQSKQEQVSTRKLKASAPPEYPELARRMNIQGLARVLLTVDPEGKVISVKELGGNPVLVNALADAAKKWKYEAADRVSLIEVRFEFR
jgi:TonB family protein